MTFEQIDKNFDSSFQLPTDVEWFSIRKQPFSIHGIVYSEEEGLFRRLPKAIADKTSQGVALLSKNTAGGRVRFITDSPYVVLRAVEPFWIPMSHMTICGTYGFSLFTNGRFGGTFMPQWDQFVKCEKENESKLIFDGIKYPFDIEGQSYQAELFFPLYSAVNEVFVGLKKGCILQSPKEYTHKKPILFYGSSITQGGCASKPADDYVNRLSRMLNTEILNLGFSGSALAEPTMVEYLCSLNPSIFVMDYDHNAPTAEYLEKTHYSLYKAFRIAHPTTPIIMMTMPNIKGFDLHPWNKERKRVIVDSFNRAKVSGDKNVYFIDCYGCFGDLENGECGTVDDCHPDSLGFLRMAERLYPLLNQLLNSKKI